LVSTGHEAPAFGNRHPLLVVTILRVQKPQDYCNQSCLQAGFLLVTRNVLVSTNGSRWNMLLFI
jgi:hypothetical protein